MFIKQLKYDLLFGRDTFLGMGALLIGASFIMAMVVSAQERGGFLGSEWILIVVGLVFAIVVSAVAVATISSLYSLFARSFFGKSGYLMLTLPVSRITQLISKLTAAIIWSNYMAVVAFIMGLVFAAILVTGTNSWHMAYEYGEFITWGVTARDVMYFLGSYLVLNMFALLVISAMYFGITLSNSTIGRWRVHRFVAGVATLLYLSFAMWTVMRVVRFFSTSLSFSLSVSAISITLLAFVVATVAATYHLINKRVDLQ